MAKKNERKKYIKKLFFEIFEIFGLFDHFGYFLIFFFSYGFFYFIFIFLIFCYFFFGFFGLFLKLFLDVRFFWGFSFILFGFLGFLSKLLRLLLKVTKVTIGHQKLLKMGQSSIISSFFAQRAKKNLGLRPKPSAGARSRPA